jgi:hypothetical protein
VTKATNLKGGVLGSIHYQSAVDTSAVLAPNATATAMYLKSVGGGSPLAGTAPTWTQIAAADIDGLGTAIGNAIGTGTNIAANSATATKWKDSVKVKFTGGATGNFTIVGNEGVGTGTDGAGISCQLTLAAAAADTVKAVDEGSASTTRYMMFTSTAAAVAPGGSQCSLGIDGDFTYKPSTGTLTATIFAGTATKANYGDLAEKYLADADYEEGTVLVFGGEHEVTQSSVFNDRRVAGVISLKAAYTMNDKLTGDYVAVVALQGRVPVKVIGRVQKGDMLVSSGKAGYAIVNNDPKVGTVIGKSLQAKTTDGEGVVEAVVGKH